MTVSRLPNNDGGIQPTILTAKGDLLTATATSTITNLPVGSNDQVLVADSTQSTGLSWKSYAAQAPAGKNAVINGGFDIWQRGTSFSTAANTSSYTTDRWQVRTYAANMANTVSRQATSDTTNLPNIQYCARVQRNSGQTGASGLVFEMGMETVNSIPYAGKTVTLSFYARAGANYSATSNILTSQIFTGTGTDQMPASYTGGVSVLQNNTLTTTWQRFTQTTTLASTTTEIALVFAEATTGTAGANDYYEITGVQLELGSTATPFARAGGNIAGEFYACRRYYARYSGGEGMAYAPISYSTSTIYGNVGFPVPMRTAPSAGVGGTLYCNEWISGGATSGAASPTIDYSNLYAEGGALRLGGFSGLTAGRANGFYFDNTYGGYVEFKAEL